MDWWLVPIGLGAAVMLRLLWVAAFHSGETVTSMPELDGYIPGERTGARPAESLGERTGTPPADTEPTSASTVEPFEIEPPAEPTKAVSAESVTSESVSSDSADGAESTVDDGIWIELDIEPLFSSSERPNLVDLTEDPDVTP